MSDKLKRTLIGALISLALAFAVSYGLISQDTADKVQTTTNEALQDDKPVPTPAPQDSDGQTPPPAAPAPQNAKPAPRE